MTTAPMLRLMARVARLYHEQFQDGLVEASCADGVVLSNGGVVRTGTAA